MLAVVETYYELAGKLSDDEYLRIIRNAVYSNAKAVEVKNTLK